MKIKLLDNVDDRFKETKPSTLILTTAGSLIALYGVNKVIGASREHPGGFTGLVFQRALSLLETLPGVGASIQQEKKKMASKIKDLFPELQSEEKVVALPLEGTPAKELLERLEKIRVQDRVSGKISGTVYMPEDEHADLLKQVYGMFMHTNPLHYDIFLSTKKFEAEIVAMTLNMLNGRSGEVGAVTSGGTESILMSLKAYRDQARIEKGITRPEIIAPKTIHAAFDKGCHYFGIKLVHIDVDQETFMVDPKQVEKKINRNTIAIAASAPNFPQGTIDPIEQLAKIALKHNVGLHVDCCLGGFVLPFAKKLGYDIPAFDFSVPGVTSISADTHKYGLAPKGSSVVMFKSKELRKHMYFLCTAWTGGIYASPSIAGSRAGALIASCWASMINLGEAGYLKSTKRIMEAAKTIEQGITTIPELHVLGKPEAMVVAFASKTLNIFEVGDRMSARHWSLNSLQYPSSLHICVTPHNADLAQQFLTDLKEAVQEVKGGQSDSKDGMAPMYGLAVTLPDKSLLNEMIGQVLDASLEV